MNAPIQICTKCVMDTSDPKITFDADGVCDYCANYNSKILPRWNELLSDPSHLKKMGDVIRRDGRGKKYDCIIGLSGGLDSSYTAYVAKEVMKVRPLLYHVDAGWNTAVAVRNIHSIATKLGLDLVTDIIDWPQMRELQKSFLRAQIPDQDLPQDAVFFSSLYKHARRMRIKHVLTGSNYSTECCREPEEWGGYLGIDKTLFFDIHKKFGTSNIDRLPLIDILHYRLWYRYILRMKVHSPLNYIPFNKNNAEAFLAKEFGWTPFKHKHHESRFTRFFEDYWLPKKYGFDKRKAHFSSLIQTGQMSREEALNRLKTQELSDLEIANELCFVCKKLGMKVDELDGLFRGTNKVASAYKNKRKVIMSGARILRMMGLEKRLFR